MTVRGERRRRGQSSVRKSAVATATGTPIASRTKKNPIRMRIAAAAPARPQRSTRSGTAASGDRRRGRRPPLVVVMEPASISLRSARPAQGLAIAREAVGRGLRLGQEPARQLRVLELREHVLAGTEAVVDERLDVAGARLLDPGLAEVLVDDHERLRGDRVGLRVRRVDDVHAQVLRDLDAFAGGRGGLERRLHELARLVLDGRGGEVVLKRVRLLDVTDRALLLLDRTGD